MFACFAFNPKFREFQLVPIKWNRPFRLGPTGIFGTSFQGSPFLPCLFISGRSDRNLPFQLTKLLTPAPLFCILFTRTITKRAVAWVPGLCFQGSPFFTVSGHFGSVGPKSPFPFDTVVDHSTAFLYLAYKNNNQTCGGLGPGSVQPEFECTVPLGMHAESISILKLTRGNTG